MGLIRVIMTQMVPGKERASITLGGFLFTIGLILLEESSSTSVSSPRNPLKMVVGPVGWELILTSLGPETPVALSNVLLYPLTLVIEGMICCKSPSHSLIVHTLECFYRRLLALHRAVEGLISDPVGYRLSDALSLQPQTSHKPGLAIALWT
jgi:hypothetical protein